ncbi:hypothetical protein ACFPK1_21420 [Actinomycetospora rhizophila]|uniref:Uncharacterized protein n=1 Tax=Actinomycetospora rhizophila TaxID=1416876 RepID=A0ABV9ZHG9_9PSEU
MTTLHGPGASALLHRWPTAVGLLVALAAVLGGADRDGVATTVAVAASCYVAAAAFSLPWMAWAWIPIASVLAVGGGFLRVDPVVTTGAVVAVLVVVGLLRGASRPALTLETAGFLGYGVVVVVALLLSPGVGLVLAALTLVAHGVWDVWHLRRHRDTVSPSLAEFCVALDVPLGLAVLVLWAAPM